MKMIQLATNAIDELVGCQNSIPLQIGFPPVAISSAKAPLFADGGADST
jgi:hypothetical protein